MSATLMTIETAKVYRVGRRRFFSKQSAFRQMAREWIKARCDCEPSSLVTRDPYDIWDNGQSCKYHDPERYPSLLARLVKLAPKYVGEVPSSVTSKNNSND